MVIYMSSVCGLYNLHSRKNCYVAKSQRTFFSKVLSRIHVNVTKWVKYIGDNIEHCIYASCGGQSSRRKAKHKHSKCTSNKGRINRRMQLRRVSSTTKMLYFAPFVCMTTSTTGDNVRRTHFDTDSHIIRVDNCATTSISSHIEDFIDPPIPLNKRIKALNGTVDGAMIGTIKWHIEDDEGKVHPIILPNSLYLKSATSRLLSPQHWAQVAKDHKPLPHGTWCATFHDRVVLYWAQQQYKRTIPLDRYGTNVATIRSAPGYNAYSVFCDEHHLDDDNKAVCYEVGMVSDVESDNEVDSNNDDSNENYIRTNPLTTDYSLSNNTSKHTTTMGSYDVVDNNLLTHVIEDEEDRQTINHAAEFLRWHHRLGHISPKKIRLMAQQGLIPTYLSRCPIPICSSCMYGKMTKRPWRTKGYDNKDETSFRKLRTANVYPLIN